MSSIPGGATIGVITICRNDIAGVQATIESIAAQTHPPYEVVVVDGASTDGTREWLAAYTGPVPLRWTSEPDDGIYDALNSGIERSTADVVMFLNAGDRFASARVLSSVSSALASGGDWGFGDALLIDSQGRVSGRHRLRAARRLSFVLGAQSVPHQALFVHRSLLVRVGPFRADIGRTADQEHVRRLWAAAAPVYVPQDLALFDTSGVTSADRPGDFARHARDHRLLQGTPILGSSALDSAVTAVVVHYKRLRSAVASRLRRR